MHKSFAIFLVLISTLTGCYYRGSGNTARVEAVYYPEPGANVLFNRPAKDGRVNGVTEFSTLDGKVPFRLITYFASGDDPRIAIEIGLDNTRRGTEKIELDCSKAALILGGQRYGQKVSATADADLQRAIQSRQAWSLDCTQDMVLYDPDGVYVYNAKLLFWPGIRLGESFSIQLPAIKNQPQASKPLIVKFVREMRTLSPIGGV